MMEDHDYKPYIIPESWSAQQALAVFDLLSTLRQEVWQEYSEKIIEQLRAETGMPERDEDGGDTVDFDDDIDF